MRKIEDIAADIVAAIADDRNDEVGPALVAEAIVTVGTLLERGVAALERIATEVENSL